MILVGWRMFKRKKGVSNDLVVCPHCGLQTHFELRHMWRWFTLFFIPLFPFWVTKVITCPHCEYAIKVNKRNEIHILSNMNIYLKEYNPDHAPVLPSGLQQVAAEENFYPQPLQVDGHELARLADIRERNAKYQGCIAAGGFHTIAMNMYGSIIADGDKKQCRITGWEQIIMVAAGSFHSVGLRSNGTVATAGGDKLTLKGIETWTDIIMVTAKDNATIGVKADGTVVAAGLNDCGGCKGNDWQDIVSVATGGKHTLGLKSDGTVVAKGKNNDGQCNTKSWTKIVAVAAGSKCSIGLRADGTLVAAGKIGSDMRNILDWKDIVAISADDCTIVGLTSRGAVKYASDISLYGMEKVVEWTGIVAVSVGPRHIVGLKADGTVVAKGMKKDGCNTESWRNIGPARFIR